MSIESTIEEDAVANAYNLSMHRGDYKEIKVTTYTDKTKTVRRNITNDVFRFTAKKRYSDTDIQAIIVKSSSDAAQIIKTDALNGECKIMLLPTDTASLASDRVVLKYDVQIVDDVIVKPQTIASGNLTIVPDISITQP